jgi:hypothetical protein
MEMLFLKLKSKYTMPRKDAYHDSVRTALENEGWTISQDPLQVVVDETTVFIDLGIEPTFFAQRQNEQIAIEIKTFRLQSSITSLYEALGKYFVYKTALRLVQSPYSLYLAVPFGIYNSFFQRRLVKEAMDEYHINLIVYNPHQNKIIKWIRH